MLFAIKSYTAGILALYIAFKLDLERPFWALISVYIVSQPLAGAVRSKAVYRIFGSFIGATATIVFVPNFVNEPLLLSLVLSLLISICLYFSVLDRTPRSYAFLLAGYTIGILGFPSVNEPNNIFYVSVARFEEITIGIICATIIHSIVFPHSVSSVFLQRVERWWNNAKKLLQEISLKHSQKKFIVAWQNLAAEISQLYILSRHLDYDTDNKVNDSIIAVLDEEMTFLLAMLYVIANSISHEKTPEISQLVTSQVELLLSTDNKSQQQLPEITAHSSWHDILKWSVSINLNKLTIIYEKLLKLQCFLSSKNQEASVPANLQLRKKNKRPLHKDYKNALFSAIATFISIMTVSIFWIEAAWPEGAYAAQLAAIGCCFFASQMNPGILVFRFIIVVILAIPIAAFYLFAVLTRVDSFFLLMTVMAPYYLIAGFFMATPRFGGAGTAAILALANLVLLQDKYDFEFANFLNVSSALLIGMGAAAFFNYIFRTPQETHYTKDLLSSIRTDLVALASGSENKMNFIFLTEDKLGLFAPFLMHSSRKYRYLRVGLKNLNIGINIINLRKAVTQLPVKVTQSVQDILNHLAIFFYSSPANEFSIDFLRQIDFALSEVTALAATDARDDALLGLCGLRQDLYPDAPPYQSFSREKTS